MAIAKLSIDLEARLANLQAGLDKAGYLAEQQAARIEARFAKLRSLASGVGAGLATAFTVPAIFAFIKRTNEGVAALEDMKAATGASVENLSALEDAAARTGTNFDTMGDALIKMNKALTDAKPGSEYAAVFDALGLSVKELKALDPVDAMHKLSQALVGYEDDANKARAVQILFGKSLKDVAPLLKDLAEQTKLTATVTAEQVAEAKKFDDALASLTKSTTDWARALAGPLVTSLNLVIERISRARGVWETLKAIDASAGILMQGGGGNTGGATGSWGEPDKPSLPKLPDTFGGASGKQAADKARAERLRAAEFAAQQLVDIEEQAAKDSAEAWKYWEKQQLGNYDERAAAAKLQWQQVFQFIDDEQARAIEEGQALLKDLGDTGEKVGEQISLALTSAAGDAITHWQGVSNLLKGILQDMAQIALRETVLKPAGKMIGDALKGFSFASLFKSIGFGAADGAAFDAGGVRRFASGDVFGSPTLFRYGGGRTGMMGEAGPEAIMPLKRGADGKLGVAGGGQTINVAINVAAGASADDWRRSQRQITSDLQRSLRRAGAIA